MTRDSMTIARATRKSGGIVIAQSNRIGTLDKLPPGQVEVPEDPDQTGQYPVAVDQVRGLERSAHLIGIRCTPERAQRYISATGRTSTEPNLADLALGMCGRMTKEKKTTA